MDLESKNGIRHGLQDFRRDALSKFIDELMPILKSEGYTLEDLLHALANWSSKQSQFDDIVGYLEKAIEKIHLTEE